MSKIALRPAQLEDLAANHPASALLWYDIDALLTLRLYYALDRSMEAATIVIHVLQFHQKHGDFDGWLELSIDKVLKTLPVNLFTRMTLNRSYNHLLAMGVLEAKPVVRNTARQFRIVPKRLAELLANVDASCPGLTAVVSNAGSSEGNE